MELDPVYVDVDIRRWLQYMLDNDLDFEIKRNGKVLHENEWKKYIGK